MLPSLYVNIRKNLEMINDQIDRAANISGRKGKDIKLVVVTKAQPAVVVEAAISAGANILGENYPEETAVKIQGISNKTGVEWHMIGHLQSRKIPLVVQYFNMLHSLDSFNLAQKLDRRLGEQKKKLPVLLEVNVSEEETKYGLPAWYMERWDELIPEIAQILTLSHIEVMGLMTMPPLFTNVEEVRPYFKKTRELRDYLKRQFPGTSSWNELSMGTSADYREAIREGATYVRIGQAILGSRPSKL